MNNESKSGSSLIEQDHAVQAVLAKMSALGERRRVLEVGLPALRSQLVEAERRKQTASLEAVSGKGAPGAIGKIRAQINELREQVEDAEANLAAHDVTEGELRVELAAAREAAREKLQPALLKDYQERVRDLLKGLKALNELAASVAKAEQLYLACGGYLDARSWPTVRKGDPLAGLDAHLALEVDAVRSVIRMIQ